MPRTDFICPDGGRITTEGCLISCRMDRRCVTLPTLMLMAKTRKWTGILSTTEALNGTRLTYLKATVDYAETPTSLAFALLGTFHHLKAQNINVPENLVEEWVEDELGSGMFDAYDSVNQILYDYKTAGCYKVNRVLGKVKTVTEIPLDEVFKSGPRKGQVKTKKEIKWGLGEPDDFEWRMQLSRYAMLLEKAGFPVKEIIVQVTVRDYNRQNARQYGLNRQIYVIPLERIPVDKVEEYYIRKTTALKEAFEKEELPPPCSPRERWLDEGDGNLPGIRCQAYCPVWDHCDLGITAHEQLAKEENDDAKTD